MKRAIFIVVAVTGISVAAAALRFGVDTSSAAATIPGSPQGSASRLAEQTAHEAGRTPQSPVASTATSGLEHVFTPADNSYPAFYRASGRDGGTCIVTTNQIVASCLVPDRSPYPGTVTVIDDSNADDVPPYVFGQVEDSVGSVEIAIADEVVITEPTNGFYLVRLRDGRSRMEDVRSVTYVLQDGERFERPVYD